MSTFVGSRFQRFVYQYGSDILFVLAVACIVVMAVTVGWGSHRQKKAFMEECTQYRKQYECEALWRHGQQE